MDRSARPSDGEPRRPSHRDQRKALQRQVLREQIREALLRPLDPETIDERIDALRQLVL